MAGLWDQNFRRYESAHLLRGLRLSLSDVKRLYVEIQQVVDRQKEAELATLAKPEAVEQATHDAYLQELRERAFSLTITVSGSDGENVLGSSADLFDDANLPKFISFIYFTNRTAYQRYASGKNPANRVDVHLDFSKPILSDPSPLLSAPTPNNSNVEVSGLDFEFVRAIDAVVAHRLKPLHPFIFFIHKSFAYDALLWFVVMPYALFFLPSVDKYLTSWGGNVAQTRYAFLIYYLVLCLIGYRVLFTYFKWTFPVNVLSENRDTAASHRIFISAIVIGLMGNLFWSLASFIWN